MHDAANLLLGTVIIIALVTLSALVLLRGKRRDKNSAQIDRREMFQPAAQPVTERKGKFSFLGNIFRIFRRNKTIVEPEAFGSELTQTLEALEAISKIQASGGKDGEKFPELTRSSGEEELTEVEANVFKGLIGSEESGETSATGDEDLEESGNVEDRLFGGHDNSLLSAFKTTTAVDEVREALLARVGKVDIQELSEEINSLTRRVKAYVPDDADI